MRAAESGARTLLFFLDTNILIYSFSGQDAAKREIARALAEADGARVSTQVLSELAHVLTRRFGVPAKGRPRELCQGGENRRPEAAVTPAKILAGAP